MGRKKWKEEGKEEMMGKKKWWGNNLEVKGERGSQELSIPAVQSKNAVNVHL